MLYYFLLAALPPLSFKAPPEMSFGQLKDLLTLNLSPTDLKRFRTLLRPIDLYNVRALWLGMPMDERGNLNAKELEEALLVRDLPLYLTEYLDRYETTAERLKVFPSLTASLFREGAEKMSGFLKRYYAFERDLRLVLSALRAKGTKRDIVRELQFEDPGDPLVASILAQKDAADFLPPKEFEDLKILFVEKGDDPEKLNRAILEYRMKRIEEMEDESDPFSIDRILGYAARFLIVDSYRQLDWEKGRMEVEKLSEYG